MDPQQSNPLQETVDHLNQAKNAVFKAIEAAGVEVTPAIASAMQSFNTFIDTTYLWTTLVSQILTAGGVQDSNKAAEEAIKKGEVINFPGPGPAPVTSPEEA